MPSLGQANTRPLRVSDIAQELGMHPNTLRAFERAGVIPEARRTDGGHRYWWPADLQRLKIVLFPPDGVVCPRGGKRFRPMSSVERFIQGFTVSEDGHWLWTKPLNKAGYARFRGSELVPGERFAHRWSYRYFKGPIPEGLTIDHLCRVRHCVNPDHLEVVTLGENVLRGNGIPALNARKTHCKRGHEFTAENTYHPPTRPECRFCKRCRRETAANAVQKSA